MTEKPTPQTKWNSSHPLEMLAHQYVRSALKRGLLQRQPCEICGKAETDAHHDDYEQPRKVRWLCRRHHQQHHADRRKA